MNIVDLTHWKIAVHCPTKATSDKFLVLAEHEGIRWASGASATNGYKRSVYTDTCYCLDTGRLQHADIAWCKENGFEVIEWEELDGRLGAMISLKDLEGKKIAVRCMTKEQNDNLRAIAEKSSLKWAAGETPQDVYNCYFVTSAGLSWGVESWFQDHEFEIIECTELEEWKDVKENLKNLIGTKVAIHCNEEGQARRLIEKLRALDYGWALRGDEIYWGIYGKRTGYFLDSSYFLQHGYLTEEGLQHGEVEIENEKFRIIEFDNLVDFEEKTETEPIKLKIVGIEEGKVFRFENNSCRYMLKDGVLMLASTTGEWGKSYLSICDITSEIILEDEIELTDTEKTILEGRYAEGYNWLAIDEHIKQVFVYTTKPVLNTDTGFWRGETNEVYYSKIKHKGFKGIKTDKAYYIKDLI